MIELTTSPTVNAVCFLSLVSFFWMRYQSNTKTIQDKTFIPQQTPTYLKIKQNEDLGLWFQISNQGNSLRSIDNKTVRR
jgi:type II secretory pathway component PulC